MTDRLYCLVPHCRRSKKASPECVEIEGGKSLDIAGEWICDKHWRNVPTATRRVYFAARKRFREHRTRRCGLVFVRLWRRCRRIAIERAVGI